MCYLQLFICLPNKAVCYLCKLLLQLPSDKHAVVGFEEGAEGFKCGVVGYGRDGGEELQEFVGVVEETYLVARLCNLWGNRAQTVEVGQCEFLVFYVEGIIALNHASLNRCRVSVVGVKGESDLFACKSQLREGSVDFFFNLCGSHFTASLHQEVFRLKYAVGTAVVPRANNVFLT